MDYFSGADIGTGWDPHQIAGWGSGEMQNSSVQQVQQATQLFRQQFQNLIGRPPTSDELGQFQSQALQSSVNAPGDLTYGDSSGISNAFIQQSFGPQAVEHQKQQQTDQLGQSQNQLQDIIRQTMGNTAGALTDPNSQIYQQLAGSMNNLGITPGSGAFQAGAGSTIANSGLNAANAGLQAIGIPGIQNIAGLTSVPYQQSFGSGQQALGHLNDLGDFGLQSSIAKMLADQSQSSGFEKNLGYANTASNIASNMAKGGAQLSGAGVTWICTQMKLEGLMTGEEVFRLHAHLYRAFWKRPIKFISYILFGNFLVYLANKYNTDWRVWKSEFYNDVMAEKDPAKAVDLYAEAFWKLYWNITAKKFLRESNAR